MTAPHAAPGAEGPSSLRHFRWFKWGAPLAVVASGLIIALWLVANRPQTAKGRTSAPVLMVETVPLKQASFDLSVQAQGTVEPARQIQLHAQVSGEVVRINPNLASGGVLREGEMLLQIDPADYQLAVLQRQSQVQEAQAQLAQELGRRKVAKREWQLFQQQFAESAERSALALREPQLRAAQAALARAEAALGQAKLQLERTNIRAPFTALVLRESVDLGQQIQPQQAIAELAGAEQFWIRAYVPVDKMAAIDVPQINNQTNGALATITYDLGHRQLRYAGRVIRVEGQLDNQSRLAQLLIAVDDPLQLLTDDLNQGERQRPLYLQAYVNLLVAARQSVMAFSIPREALREGNKVYLFENGQLRIKPVEITWRREEDVLVEEGLDPGALLITSNVPAPIEGMALRKKGTKTSADTPQTTANLSAISQRLPTSQHNDKAQSSSKAAAPRD